MTIPNLSFKGSNLKITIKLEDNEIVKTKTTYNGVLPTVAIEFYGKMADELIDSANLQHKLAIEKNKNKTSTFAVKNSISYITHTLKESEIMTPVYTQNNDEPVKAVTTDLPVVQAD